MDKCQCCGEEGQDRRTLFMECFYAMEELGIPFNRLILQDREGNERTFYTLKVCKECRANWMNAIKQWFNNVQKQGSCGSGIFVRRNGATVEIPREEWDKQNPGREPVVFKGEQ